MSDIKFSELHQNILACKHCASELPVEPNPVLQISPKARILIAGQAPGRIVHETNIPFNDQSGDRLRNWMGIDKSIFYDANSIAIVPMGFCYPGTGKSGDLPPRKECATQWRKDVLDNLPNIKLTLLIGQYAMKWHLGNNMSKNLTTTIQNWRDRPEDYPKDIIPLPHPSPRNYGWFKKNPWFELEVLAELKRRVKQVL